MVSKMVSERGKPGESITAEQESQVVELEVVLKTNMAICYIKLENASKALDCAKDALALNPNSWKAMMRKGEVQIVNTFYY